MSDMGRLCKGSTQREAEGSGQQSQHGDPEGGPWGHPRSRQMAGPLRQGCLPARARPSDRRQEAGGRSGQGAGAIDRSQASVQVSEGGTRQRLGLQEEAAL